jgi:hypothetical protein
MDAMLVSTVTAVALEIDMSVGIEVMETTKDN